jgi:hypothetical protein
MLGSGNGYIARFVPDHIDGVPWTYTKIEDLELAEAEKPTAEPETFPGMSVRDLVDRIFQATWSEGGSSEDIEPVKAAVTEIHHRLEAIQMYQGTEAVIIRMILAGRRPADG